MPEPQLPGPYCPLPIDYGLACLAAAPRATSQNALPCLLDKTWPQPKGSGQLEASAVLH